MAILFWRSDFHALENCVCLHALSSLLHILILSFFYALFVRWSIFPTMEKIISFKHWKWHLYLSNTTIRGVILHLLHHVLLFFPSPLEPIWLTLTSQIESFKTTQHAPLNENKQFESEIIQWRLLFVSVGKRSEEGGIEN